ncbi:MAG: hypothetical protein AAGA73_08415, partial [Pseudomonadota bacterium]
RTFRTRLAEIDRAKQAAGATVAPTGFIFHMSRCGSTLLGNVLGGSRKNLVVNQPGPLQDGFWTYLTKGWTQTRGIESEPESALPLAMFRDLVSLILRKRSMPSTAGFIKFRSWAVLFLPFVRRAFPDVPCLFLYRDPHDVIGSVLQKKNVAAFGTNAQRAFLARSSQHELKSLSELQFMARCYEAYFTIVLEELDQGISLMNYRDLKPESLASLLNEVFRLRPDDKELSDMISQFNFYSKDKRVARTKFNPVRDKTAKAAKLQSVSPDVVNENLMKIYFDLERSPRNLFSK